MTGLSQRLEWPAPMCKLIRKIDDNVPPLRASSPSKRQNAVPSSEVIHHIHDEFIGELTNNARRHAGQKDRSDFSASISSSSKSSSSNFGKLRNKRLWGSKPNCTTKMLPLSGSKLTATEHKIKLASCWKRRCYLDVKESKCFSRRGICQNFA